MLGSPVACAGLLHGCCATGVMSNSSTVSSIQCQIAQIVDLKPNPNKMMALSECRSAFPRTWDNGQMQEAKLKHVPAASSLAFLVMNVVAASGRMLSAATSMELRFFGVSRLFCAVQRSPNQSTNPWARGYGKQWQIGTSEILVGLAVRAVAFFQKKGARIQKSTGQHWRETEATAFLFPLTRLSIQSEYRRFSQQRTPSNCTGTDRLVNDVSLAGHRWQRRMRKSFRVNIPG